MKIDLHKILFGTERKANHNIGLTSAFKHYIAQNSVQTFDRRLTFSAKQTELEDMGFLDTLQGLGYYLSAAGDGYALVAYKVEGKEFIDFAEVANYLKIANQLKWVELETGRTVEVENGDYPIRIRFDIHEEKGVIKNEVYYDQDEMFLVEGSEEVVYGGKIIPVEIMKNNSLGKADIPEEMRLLLAEYDYYGDQLGVEWEKIKTQYLNNLLYGSTKDGAEWSKDMQSGKDVHDVSDDDGRLQGALSPLISGSTTPNIILTNLQFIEDKVLKYSNQFRETMGGGSNKHNMEVAGENKQAFEYMLFKNEFRTRQLNAFFKKIGWDVTVEITIPELEEIKLASMIAQVNNMDAQSANQLGQAENQKAQAVAVLTAPVAKEGE